MPGGAAEREHLRAFREDLDLARRAEHGADVPVLQRRAGVRLIRARARDLELSRLASLAAPALDVDDVEQPALGVGEEHGPHAVRQPEEALDGGQRLACTPEP